MIRRDTNPDGDGGYCRGDRRDFPEVFAARAKLERDRGTHIFKDCYLDELDTAADGPQEETPTKCNIFCQLITDTANDE